VIRVNLLPQKKKSERSSPVASSGGQKWLLVVLGVLVLETVGLIVFHQTKQSELDAQNAKNAELNGQIASIQQLVTQHDQVKKDLALLKAREDAISSLEKARTGPTSVLLEVSQLLTQGKGPTADQARIDWIKKNKPLQAYNPGWDSRRLWIGSYKEQSRTVQMDGVARDSTDVSELAYRLMTSDYFYDVKLLPGKKSKTTDELGLVGFGIEMKVRY
jgi:type IV pilus assembly protein PilN